MIKKIKSIKNDSIVINLENPFSSLIYEVTSINLIIGDNGSGKTRLIKSIISDLVQEGPPKEFVFEGAKDSLGVVYYTAAPFHRPISPVNNKVMFTDASASQDHRSSFVLKAYEYLEVAEKLGINDALKSTRLFEFEYAALDMAWKLFKKQSNFPKRRTSQEFKNLEQVERAYSDLEKELETLQIEIRAENNRIGLASSIPHEKTSQTLESKKIAELNVRLEALAKDRIEHQNLVIDDVLFRMGPASTTYVAIWISYCCLMDDERYPYLLYTVADFLYDGNYKAVLDKNKMPSEWNRILQTVLDFARAIENEQVGDVSWNKAYAAISVDTAKLLQSPIEHYQIEAAYRAGLLHLGFDRLSSGEAAILHQLTSISQAIHATHMAGKQNILVFVDEGDLLLHLSWQRRYLDLLDSRLGVLKTKLGLESIQLVIATHSPILATDILRDSVNRTVRSNSGFQFESNSTAKIPTFGAPLQKIVNYSFDTSSVGSIAERTIISIRDSNGKNSVEDLKIINQIDDDFIRDHLSQKK